MEPRRAGLGDVINATLPERHDNGATTTQPERRGWKQIGAYCR